LTISNPAAAEAGSGFGDLLRIWIWGEHVLGSQNNVPDETNGINNAVSCYKEAEQFGAFLVTSLPVFDKIRETQRSLYSYRSFE